MTKSELKKYMRMDAELRRLEEILTELRTMIESPKSAVITGMPKGGEHRNIADYIDKLIELQDLYNRQWDLLIDERLRIEQAISTLSDPVERALIGYKYIDGLTWEEICVKTNYSWRQIHRIHGNALKNMA